MKKHLSVLMLLARSSIQPILGLFLLMAAVQGGLYFLGVGQAADLPALMDGGGFPWVFRAGLLLTTALLCLTGCAFGAQPGYTLDRLSLSRQAVYLWQCGYNAGVYFLLWGSQLAVALVLCALYLRQADPAQVNAQTLFLAFYRSNYLHTLLPLEDVYLWVRNGMLGLCLGICAARFPLRQRQGKWATEIVLMALVAVCFFLCPLGDAINAVAISIISLGVAVLSVYSTLGGASEHEAA